MYERHIPRAGTFYTCYSLLTVIMCNLGPGHNDEVVRRSRGQVCLTNDLVDVVFVKRWFCIQKLSCNKVKYALAIFGMKPLCDLCTEVGLCTEVVFVQRLSIP